MLRFEIKNALSAADSAAWDTLLADGNPAPSPYLTPGYFQAVARARTSARVLIGTQSGTPVLFFPFHCGGVTGTFGFGRAIGGPVSDVQGVIARHDIQLDAKTLMRAAGLTLLPMAHVAAADPVFRPANAAEPRHAFHVMDLARGFTAYEQDRTPFARSAFKALRTRLAKAEAQFGPVTHRFWDTDKASLAALLGWKRQQFSATGQVNVLEVDWVRALADDLLGQRQGLRAQLSSLWFGDTLVAGHLGLRTPTTLHYWFPAYDAAVQELSPGNLLLYRMAEAAAAEGVRQIHLGAGDYRYKLEFANCAVAMRKTVVMAPSWPGRLVETGERAMGALERLLPPKLAPLPGGVLRRLDRHLAFRAL